MQNSPDNPLTEPLTQAVAAARSLAISQLVSELMVALHKEGYRFEDLLEALADYASQRPDWDVVVNHLEQSSSEVRRIRRDSP